MTPDELYLRLFQENFPPFFEVDAETYALACDSVFKAKREKMNYKAQINWIDISIGPNGGLFFRNVELILMTP